MKNDREAADAAPHDLEYGRPVSRSRRHVSIGPPIPWLLALLVVGLASLPFWFGLGVTSVDALYLRPMLDGVLATLLGSILVAGILINAAVSWISARQPGRGDALRAWTRIAIIVLASAAFLYLDSNGFGLRLRFEPYRSEFEAARRAAEAQLAPGESAPHGPIGPFPFVRVERGVAGGVAFVLDTNSGIQYGNETLLVPPGDGGSLGGGWRWEATD